MKGFRSLDWFLLRSAFLSHREGEELLQSKGSVRRVLEDPYLCEVIASTSPVLYQEFENNPSDDKVLEAVFNSLSRMTFRSVPFGSYASVSPGRIEEGTESALRLSSKEHCLRSFREKGEVSNKVALNPTLFFEGTTAKYVKQTLTENKKKKFQFAFTYVPPELIRRLRQDPNKLAPEVVQHLLSLSILVSEGSKDIRIERETLKESLMSGQSKTISTFNIEMLRPLEENTLSKSVADEFLLGAEVLRSFFPQIENKLDLIKPDFFRKYEYQEVPLVELLSPDNIVGKKFSRMLEQAPANPSLNDIEEKLLGFISRKVVLESKALRLTSSDVEEMRKINFNRPIPPDSFIVSGEGVFVGDEKCYKLKDVRSPAIGHFARYPQLDPVIEKNIRGLVQEETKLRPETLFAEILHKGEFEAVQNISPELNFYEGCIPVSLNTSFEKTTVGISDLYVYFEDHKFKLRSKTHNREVLPVLTNLHSFELDGNPFYQFLSFVQLQYGFSSLSWVWGKLKYLPFLPRVTYRKLILSEARWRISLEDVLFLRDPALSLAAMKEKLEGLGIPKIFELEGPVSALRFDLGNELSLLSLRKFLKPESMVIKEILPSSGVTTDDIHSHDLIVPFIREKRLPESPRNYHYLKKKEPPLEKVVFPPESEWTYCQLYLSRISADALIAQELSLFVKKLKGRWFFLRFSDPEFHLRIRVQGKEGKKLMSFAKKLVLDRKIESFEVKTYRREIERYGGLKGCENFEILSQIDSETCLQAMKYFENQKLPKLEFWILCSLLSIRSYLDVFQLTPEERLQVLATFSPESGLRPGRVQKLLNASKRIFMSDESLPEGLCELYNDRFLKQKIHVKKLLLEFKRNEIFIEKRSYIRSLIHLSLIRLDLEFSSQYESRVVRSMFEIETYKKN